MTVTIGSLCSGFGGLDRAAEKVTGGRTVWHCEYDGTDKAGNLTGPRQLLAHHHPDVPNYVDLKALTWADDPVDVLTAGYPCQPFSQAGSRRGTDDPRHLFPWIVQGVERMRPALLLLENVRGHLSLGFDVVLAELDRIGYDVRWTLLRAADVGAPHGRSRLWIAARDRQAGGWPTPQGAPTAYAEHGNWTAPDAGLFGGIPAGPLGTRGAMVDGCRWDSTPDAPPLPRAVLLPTPEAKLSDSGPDYARANRDGSGGDDLTTTVHRYLLPTPTTQDGSNNGGRSAARLALLPTPKASDGEKGGPNQRFGSGSLTLPSAVQPSAWGPYAAAVARWEALTRPAPAPTEPGRNGPRLSPAFVEWLMGLPAGWVTDAPGITRNHALKLLGNGVVAQCATAAYALLGVADLYREAAA